MWSHAPFWRLQQVLMWPQQQQPSQPLHTHPTAADQTSWEVSRVRLGPGLTADERDIHTHGVEGERGTSLDPKLQTVII